MHPRKIEEIMNVHGRIRSTFLGHDASIQQCGQSNNGNKPKRFLSKKILKFLDCMKILLSCLQNLGKGVKQLHILTQSNNVKHIKSERHYSDLTESINFMTKNLMIMRKIGLRKKNWQRICGNKYVPLTVTLSS